MFSQTDFEERGYPHATAGAGFTFDKIELGSFMFRLNIKVHLTDQITQKNIPVGVVVKPKATSLETVPPLEVFTERGRNGH